MAEGAGTISLTVKTSKKKETLDTTLGITVGEFKNAVSAAFDGVGVAQLCLIFSGKILKDEFTLESYGLKDGVTVHLVIKAGAKGAPAAAPATQAASTSASSTTAASSSSAPSPAGGSSTTPGPAGAPAANPFGGMFADLLGAGGAGGAGGLDGGMFGGQNMQQMQQMLMSNPEMMQNMMQSPMFQSLMSNPQVLQSMIQQNPQLQEMISRNPQLGHVLNDPENLRQVMQMASNPAMLSEMQNRQDRMLSNLESMPGGMSALEGIYRNIQEPLQQATAFPNPYQSAIHTQNTGAAPASTTPTTAPLPNPWASGSPSPSSAPSQAAPAANPLAGLFQTPLPTTTSASVTSTAGTSSSPSTSTDGSSSTSSTPAPAVNPFASMLGGAPGANPFASMMGGAGMPAMDPQMMSQMMSNPVYQQLMQNLISNPAMMEQVLSGNPMFASNPALAQHVRQSMNNPMFQQLVSNPQVLQAMSGLSQASPQSQPSTEGSPAAPQPSTGGTPAPAPGGFDMGQLSQMMQSMMGGSGGVSAPAQGGAFGQSQESLEQQYSAQLDQLQTMGFYDRGANIQALIVCNGDVNLAVNHLLG